MAPVHASPLRCSHRQAPGRSPLGSLLSALSLVLGLAAACPAWAGAPAASTSAGPGKPQAQRASKPEWAKLTVGQQQALAPLRTAWPGLSESRKRKWLALARNFNDLPPSEQARLHSRMAEWVALSPQQRAQARLNFGDAQQLSDQDKREAWKTYQALPESEKRRLAAGAQPRTPPTAVALRPVPADKLAPVPRAGSETRAARIEPPVTPPAH